MRNKKDDEFKKIRMKCNEILYELDRKKKREFDELICYEWW